MQLATVNSVLIKQHGTLVSLLGYGFLALFIFCSFLPLLFLYGNLMPFQYVLVVLEEDHDLRRRQMETVRRSLSVALRPPLHRQGMYLVQLRLRVIHIHSFFFFNAGIWHVIEVEGRHLNLSQEEAFPCCCFHNIDPIVFLWTGTIF